MVEGPQDSMDMIFQLPYQHCERYNEYIYNGQSAMLQDVRKSLRKTYTGIGGDGQVVKISFSDGLESTGERRPPLRQSASGGA